MSGVPEGTRVSSPSLRPRSPSGLSPHRVGFVLKLGAEGHLIHLFSVTLPPETAGVTDRHFL